MYFEGYQSYQIHSTFTQDTYNYTTYLKWKVIVVFATRKKLVNVSFKFARKCHSLNNCIVTSFFDCRGKYWSKIVMTIWEHEWYYQVSTIPMYWYCKESKKPLEAIIVVELAMEYLLMTLKSKVNQSSLMLNVSMHSRDNFLRNFEFA